jgi:hypothetical protein
VHYGTDSDRPIRDDQSTPVEMYLRRDHMLLIIALLLALTAAVIIVRLRVPGGVNAAKLGWMSEQWLAEHRASHPR